MVMNKLLKSIGLIWWDLFIRKYGHYKCHARWDSLQTSTRGKVQGGSRITNARHLERVKLIDQLEDEDKQAFFAL